LSGYGSSISIGGRYFEYNRSPNPDELAIYNDWRMIGEDLEKVIKENPISEDHCLVDEQ
jgi:hypothetical protein